MRGFDQVPLPFFSYFRLFDRASKKDCVRRNNYTFGQRAIQSSAIENYGNWTTRHKRASPMNDKPRQLSFAISRDYTWKRGTTFYGRLLKWFHFQLTGYRHLHWFHRTDRCHNDWRNRDKPASLWTFRIPAQILLDRLRRRTTNSSVALSAVRVVVDRDSELIAWLSSWQIWMIFVRNEKLKVKDGSWVRAMATFNG